MADEYCNNRPTQDIDGRAELQESPYEKGFTQMQLNMRRKAEILKYNATKSSSQTNAPTRKQVFSKIVNGNYSPCPIDSITKPVSTTASNIPGPPMYLYEDPNVPLYNYLKDTDAVYGNLPPDENAYETTWSYTSNIDQTTGLDYVLVSSIFILYKTICCKWIKNIC